MVNLILYSGKFSHGEKIRVLYLLDQTPLLINCRSRIVAAPLEVLNEIVAALK